MLTKKRNRDGSVARLERKLAALRYLQGFLEHTYASVADFVAIRTALAVAGRRNYRLEQEDACTAFFRMNSLKKTVMLYPRRSQTSTLIMGKIWGFEKDCMDWSRLQDYGSKIGLKLLLLFRSTLLGRKHVYFEEKTYGCCFMLRIAILMGNSVEKIEMVMIELQKSLE